MKAGSPTLPAGQGDYTAEIQALHAELALYRGVLEEIVACSQVLKSNPNCRYILTLAEGALKKTMKAQKVAKTAIICK